MAEEIEQEMMSRRRALSFLTPFALLATPGLALLPTVLISSDAEAQTVGMHRRASRRHFRQTRRQVRRGNY
jgi:hypothetical protein